MCCSACSGDFENPYDLVLEAEVGYGEKLMSQTLQESIDKLEQTALKVKEERDLLLNAIHKIAYEPFGPADASHAQVMNLIEEFARETYRAVVEKSVPSVLRDAACAPAASQKLDCDVCGKEASFIKNGRAFCYEHAFGAEKS